MNYSVSMLSWHELAGIFMVQCQSLQQQLGWLARVGPPLGTGEQPTTSTSGGSAQDLAGEPGENKGLISYHCDPSKKSACQVAKLLKNTRRLHPCEPAAGN